MSAESRFRERAKLLIAQKDRQALKRLFVETAAEMAMAGREDAIDHLLNVLKAIWFAKQVEVNIRKFDHVPRKRRK